MKELDRYNIRRAKYKGLGETRTRDLMEYSTWVLPACFPSTRLKSDQQRHHIFLVSRKVEKGKCHGIHERRIYFESLENGVSYCVKISPAVWQDLAQGFRMLQFLKTPLSVFQRALDSSI